MFQTRPTYLSYAFRLKVLLMDLPGSKKIWGTWDKLSTETDGVRDLTFFGLPWIQCRGQYFRNFLRYFSQCLTDNWQTYGEGGMAWFSVKSSPHVRVKKSRCLPKMKNSLNKHEIFESSKSVKKIRELNICQKWEKYW